MNTVAVVVFVLKTEQSIFIFELKYKKSADTAMAQISDKDYAKAFADLIFYCILRSFWCHGVIKMTELLIF